MVVKICDEYEWSIINEELHLNKYREEGRKLKLIRKAELPLHLGVNLCPPQPTRYPLNYAGGRQPARKETLSVPLRVEKRDINSHLRTRVENVPPGFELYKSSSNFNNS